jgi:hypothetical protein
MSVVIIADSEIDANRRKFIAALRSGRYTKIRGMYFGDDPFACCAAGVAARELGVVWDGITLTSVAVCTKLDIPPFGLLINDILRWNDEDDLPFAEIADRLETEWGLA